MEDALQEKEQEREQMVKDLHQTQKRGEKPTQDLELKLKEKDDHISNMRAKQKELREISGASARNHSELVRLKSEVQEMKRKKVELQKQLGQERKHHASEKRQLEKNALQKERELNKWKRLTSQREIQAEKANQVAKARLEELGHLRSKFKDAEKKLRIMSLKRGVMQKAGLDPVLVGRRNRDGEPNQYTENHMIVKSAAKTEVDTDSLRDHFDQKVADVVRKEAIADKLAQEWEEHFELTAKRQDFIDSGYSDPESIQSLSVQIRFKEERIRQFASRLSKRKQEAKDDAAAESDCYLFDGEFSKVCSGENCLPMYPANQTMFSLTCASLIGFTGEQLIKAAAKVLFGMVVRERRRVAALARTASSLDERAQAAEKVASVNEQALRSYMDEQRRELAALTNAQQAQILSLTDFVKGKTTRKTKNPDAADDDDDACVEDSFGPKLLVLANERIALLERQIEDLSTENETSDFYRRKTETLQSELTEIAQEKSDLEEEISGLRSMMRQIRDIIGAKTGDTDTTEAILDMISDALHPRLTSTASKSRRNSPLNGSGRRGRIISPRLKKHVELMHTSDSEDGDEAPEWAADIMADLALISQGTKPPWIQDSEELAIQELFSRNSSASDTDRQPQSSFFDVSKAVSPTCKADRRAMTRDISDRLNSIVLPVDQKISEESVNGLDIFRTVESNTLDSALDNHDEISDKAETASKQALRDRSPFDSHLNTKYHESDSNLSGRSTADQDYKPVFERLASPSHYTGTHKEKFHSKKEKKRSSQPPQDSASRLLDDLLQSDNEAPAVILHKEVPTVFRSAVVSDYTKQNVFERLTQKTTRAYAVKQNGISVIESHENATHKEKTRPSPEQPNLGQGKDGSLGAATGTTSHPFTERSAAQADYVRQDVFTRLSKTTTEAYALKTLTGARQDHS